MGREREVKKVYEIEGEREIGRGVGGMVYKACVFY